MYDSLLPRGRQPKGVAGRRAAINWILRQRHEVDSKAKPGMASNFFSGIAFHQDLVGCNRA